MPKKLFINESEYHRLHRELTDALKAIKDPNSTSDLVDKTFLTYGDYLARTDQVFPMLLLVGEFPQLPRSPSDIILLPPIADLPNRRVLIAQFPRAPGQAPALTFIDWHLAGNDISVNPARVRAFGTQDKHPVSEFDLVEIPPEYRDECDLSERPRHIRIRELSEWTLVVQLDYRTGSLILKADPQDGVVKLQWRAKDFSELPQTERISDGDMPIALRIRRCLEGPNWADDELLPPEDHPESNHPLPLKDPLIGRIRAMDGPDKSSVRYLAADHGRAMAIDVNDGRVRKSRPLGGFLEDIAVVRDPKRDKPILLVPCHDGKIYWLEDNGKKLEICHWQDAEQLHIRRILSSGADQVLAMDQYHRLCPLRLNDVFQHTNLRRKAPRELASKVRNFSIREEIARGDTQSLERLARAHASALIIDWLNGIHTTANSTIHSLLHERLGDLERVLTSRSSSHRERQTAAVIWHQMLKETWHVFAVRCQQLLSEGGQIPVECKPMMDKSRWPDATATLFRLHRLPDQAPDWLWLKLFRRWDLLARWAELQGLSEDATFDQRLAQLKKDIYRLRAGIAQHGYELRPLTPVSSIRLPGQARHIRRLSKSGNRFVCVVYGHGLYTFDLEQRGDIDEFSAPIRYSDQSEGWDWDGQIRSIAAEVKDTDGQLVDGLFLIGSQRGEIRLLRVSSSGYRVLDRAQIPLDCANLRTFWLKNEDGRLVRGFFVAGRGPDEHAEIGWLGLDDNNRLQPYRRLYRSACRGRIRMMAHNAQRKSELWAIDEIRGELLYWADLSALLYTSNPLPPPQVLYRSSGHLYALYRANRPPADDGKHQIVCAGHDGVAVAFDAGTQNPGQLRWSIGCGTAVRRLRMLHGGREQTLFVLGGDSPHVLCYDDWGRLTGMLEDVGPISAIGVLGDAHGTGDQLMLLGAKSGRLLGLRLTASMPQAGTDLSQDAMSYPLRRPSTLGSLKTQQISSLLGHEEPLLFQEGLRHWWHYQDINAKSENYDQHCIQAEHVIRCRGGEPGQVDNCVHRSALSVRRPCGGHNGRTAWRTDDPALEPWVDAHWRALAQRAAQDILCQIVDGVQFAIEPVATTRATALQVNSVRPLRQDAPAWIATRLEQWSDCIWWEPWKDNESEKTPPANCPDSLRSPNRRRLMRLAQAMRAWRTTRQESGITPDQTVPTWINRLGLNWGQQPQIWWWRLVQLRESAFPFVGVLRYDSWSAYLNAPEDEQRIRATPLAPLYAWQSDGKNWPTKAIEQLIQAFPGHPDWHPWVARLLDLVREIRNASMTRPHLAYREEELLRALLEHVTTTAEEQLSAPRGLAMAALFWDQRREEGWVSPIMARQDALHEQTLDPGLRHCLDIRTSYHWKDRNHVEVRLRLRFRGTRPLIIEAARFNGNLVPAAPRNVSIPPDNPNPENWRQYVVPLDATDDGRLDGELQLTCRDFRNLEFIHNLDLNDTRGLEGFRAEPGWPKNARALLELLESGRKLLWLRGPDWSEEEHARLENLVRERYPDSAKHITRITQLEEGLVQDTKLFAAGFVPRPHRLVDSVHGLLHQSNRGGLVPLALAIWLAARNDLDLPKEQQLADALGDLIPSLEQTEGLMIRLLSRPIWQALRRKLLELPTEELTAWSCGGPLRAGSEPAIGELGIEFWRTLFDADLPDQCIMTALGLPLARINAMRHQLEEVVALDHGVPSEWSDAPDIRRSLAKPLLDSLLPGQKLATQWRVPFAAGTIELLQQDFDEVYVLFPGLTLNPRAVSKEKLWLVTGRQEAPKGLKGVSLTLSDDQVLQLVSTETADQARHRLNEIAGAKLGINATRVFQASHGISVERIRRSFHGRETERTKLSSTASAFGGRGILLVGGRRAGKTTLLDQLQADLQSQDDERLWVDMIFLPVPTQRDQPPRDDHDDARSLSTPLLRHFLEQIRASLRQQGEEIRYDWPDSANHHQRDDALAVFERRLSEIRENRGATVLMLDETKGLLQADTGGWIGQLLRCWLQKNLINLIASSYPHGSDRHPSLYRVCKQPNDNNPWYNLFTEEEIILSPWSPRVTADFLPPRLAGFGISLPAQLNESVLALCRGIPWIAQEIGLTLCGNATLQRRRLTLGDWESAESHVSNEIRNHIADVVQSLAKNLDREAGVDPAQDSSSALGPGRLWQALVNSAPAQIQTSIDSLREEWPEPAQLDRNIFFENLRGISPDRIQDALVALSEAGLLLGEQNNKDFYFMNDLIPSVLRRH